ncbi:MFS transporter [Limisphaera ngatamarikiensis]|uniref:MFS transporter n=1 Tax=Limisphaera ngatamarikiensis TaxID=1324935 RepID=A0A6M1RRS6_9BACT|nr:MFS transporter [Limisphaera ngatamarikiensis]NGO40097.1 MFS transporter [Limisphaera ngatamarikiensis]
MAPSPIHQPDGKRARQRRVAVYYTVAGLNSFATVLYFYYLYFFTRETFGFENRHNLWLAALQGGVYALGSWLGGKAAERLGYHRCLVTGLATMALALAAGPTVQAVAGHVVLMTVVTLGMACTWPALEALVNEGRDRHGIHHSVGLYNLVWASTGAVAYFVGGALLQQMGMGALYKLPLLLVLVELALALLAREAPQAPDSAHDPPRAEPATSPPPEGQRFLHMAWLANPAAYMAIQTLIAVMPEVAARLGLSTAEAGLCGSVWCFARLGAFGLLWRWSGWHYRSAWLLGSFLVLTLGFLLTVLAPSLLVLIPAQIGFGAALGLIYSSSLFYSMDAGETKGEHGGFHEAAIGLGNMTGPLVGALALQLTPQIPQSGTVGVTLLLAACGWGLWSIRPRDNPSS